MPQRTKYSEEKAEAIAKAIRAGNTLRVAAILNGITYETLRVWREQKPAFSVAVEKAEAEAESLHVGAIVSEGVSGNWQASAWWLERRRHDDWRKPVERQEISGVDGQPLTVKVLKGVSMDDLR